VAAWDDPSWTIVRRKIIEHPQGVCLMAQSISSWTGTIRMHILLTITGQWIVSVERDEFEGPLDDVMSRRE
tara:strand:- start:480 stop:692 length:213 start_codon:yes stop_codon:yes gene_type:complete